MTLQAAKRVSDRVVPWIISALLASLAFHEVAGGQPMEQHYQAACAALTNGKTAKAELELKLALQNNPLHARSHFLLASLLEARGELDQAVVGFKRALTLEPDNTDILYNMGTTLLSRGEAAQAARLLELTVTIRPNHVAGYNNLAKAYFLSGLPELAIATYREALLHKPDNAIALKNLVALGQTASDRETASAPGQMIKAPVPQNAPPAAARRIRITDPTIAKTAGGDLTFTDDSERMLEVDAIIFYVLKLDTQSLGFNFLRFIKLNFNYFATDHAREVIVPSTILDVAQMPQQGWLFSAAVDYDVNIANASNDEVALLARPHLTTLSGAPAKFLAGGELVFKVSGNISGDIKLYPYGTTLSVTPTLLRTAGENGNPRIHMVVEAGRTSILSVLTASLNETASFSKITVNSEAVLDLGQTLILSGLNQRESTTVHFGVPILRSIPIIKYLFSTKTIADSQLSVIILLTPRDPAFINEQTRKAISEYVEMRRAFIQAMQGTDEDMRCFKERYPDWNQIPPNYFASHNFLIKNSEFYRSFNGQDLSSDDLELGLLGTKIKKKGL